MPFHVETGSFAATASGSSITPIARSDTPPEISLWGRVKDFFCSSRQSEAQGCIQMIFHPPAGTTGQELVNRFEQLRTLAYSGCGENIQSGRHGENHFCILDENSREILSVTLEDAKAYTLAYEGHEVLHTLTVATQEGDESENTGEEHADLQTSGYTARTLPHTVKEYEAMWSEWERAAPPNEAEERARVVEELNELLYDFIHCRDVDLPEKMVLELRSNSTLTSLPTLPYGLLELLVEGPSLTSLPPLPDSLKMLRVVGTSLTSLPPLPDSLEELMISNTPLISLPAALPSSLKVLTVNGTSLNSLPPLPDSLEVLQVDGTSLNSLPALPGSLKELRVQNTSLASLPALPGSLRELRVKNTPLTSLPPLPANLRRLLVENTSLTRLPVSLAGLRSGSSVTLSNNPLSEHTLQALQDMTSAPGYSGPRIEFDMAGSSVPPEARALHLAVADWLAPAKEGEPAPAGRWQAYGREGNAASFSYFLDRLSHTENCKKNPGFKAQIASWLTQLDEDDGLRAKTFAMATEATSSCEDRVTLALNQMKNVQLIHSAERGEFDKHLPRLVTVGREMFRLEKLAQIAREKVKTLRFVDEIEVYLGYQNKLKKPLGLTSVTEEMRFFEVSHITESDLDDAEMEVKAAEDSQFTEWILQWAPLHSVLERAAPERWEALSEKKISAYDDSYRTLSDTELKPAGLLGDTEAERIVGARAMERAEKAFLDGLRPLVEEMLGGELKQRWF